MVSGYREAGYTGFVITDHFYYDYFDALPEPDWPSKIDRFLSGYRAAKSEGDKYGFDVLLGYELRFFSAPDDYLVYGVDEDFLYRIPEPYMMPRDKYADMIRENGGLIFIAHPFRKREIPEERIFDGIEVYNGNPRHPNRNHLAYEKALGLGCIMLSGSDCHRLDELGSGGVLLSRRVSTSKELAEELRNGTAGLTAPVVQRVVGG